MLYNSYRQSLDVECFTIFTRVSVYVPITVSWISLHEICSVSKGDFGSK